MMTRARPLLLIAVAWAAIAPFDPAWADVVAVDRVSSTVQNLQRSVRFYERGLGFKLVRYERRSGESFSHLIGVPQARARVAVLKLGDEVLELVQYSRPGRPIPADSRSPDLWFQHIAIVVSDMHEAYTHLQRLRPRSISTGGPQQLPPETGQVEAFKFDDPDGHPLELLYFPQGIGRQTWQSKAHDNLFLGIDHSAIGVSNTPASLLFYSKLLGLKITYESLNKGSAQESLDGTLNAVVRITGLRPAGDGPGIEFLDYRTPPTGRPAPTDEMSNDLAHMHLVLRVDGLPQMISTLTEQGVRFVAPQLQPVGHGLKGILIRDPDLHEVMLVGE